jgi:hypothetical protein
MLTDVNDIEIWRDIWKQLINKMNEMGLRKPEMYALTTQWAAELIEEEE